MEGGRQADQALANQEEEEPCHKQSDNTLNDPGDCRKRRSLCESPLCEIFETCRAEDAIVVFGNTLPAEILATFRASCGRLPPGMIETTLKCKIGRRGRHY